MTQMTIFDGTTTPPPPVVPVATAPAATAPKKDSAIGIVHVMDGTTRHSRWSIASADSDWMSCALLAYPVSQDDETKLPLIEIPMEFAAWDNPVGTLSFNACTYTATEDFLAAMRGRKLHTSDREWLAKHPWSRDDGLGPNVMPMALHQMLEPYGMGVSRIRLRQGTLVAPELRHWMDVLGCNPVGTFDASTSNATFAAQAGLTEAQANEMFRFEFADAPIAGSIIGEKYVANATGFQTGYGGGHARYLAPRGGFAHWVISMTVAPLAECRYVTQPVGPEYVARTLPKRWDMSHTKRPDGCPVGVLVGRNYVPPEQVDAARAALPPTPPKPVATSYAGGSTANAMRYPTKDYTPKEYAKVGAIPEIGQYTHDGLKCVAKVNNPDGTVRLSLYGDHPMDALQHRLVIPQPVGLDPVWYVGATTSDGHVVTDVQPATANQWEITLRDRVQPTVTFRRWVARTPQTPADFTPPGTTDTPADRRSAGAVSRPEPEDDDGWDDEASAMYQRLQGVRSLAPEVSMEDDVYDLDAYQEAIHELESAYWPYSAPTCTDCDCWLVEDPAHVQLAVDQTAVRQLRWTHTSLCIDCAMGALDSNACQSCHVPLAGRTGDALQRIEPREFWELPPVVGVLPEGFALRCAHCATDHAINAPDARPVLGMPTISNPQLERLLEYDIVGDPDTFDLASSGVDLFAEYQAMLETVGP